MIIEMPTSYWKHYWNDNQGMKRTFQAMATKIRPLYLKKKIVQKMFGAKILKFVGIVFRLLCLIGFNVHVIFICTMYFKYPTNSKLSMVEVETSYTPSYAVCIPFLDISNESCPSCSSKKMLELTPHETRSFSRCAFRDDMDIELVESQPESCYSWFAIDRFVLSEFVCYRIQRREFKNITINSIVNSLHNSTQVFAFSFGHDFSRANIIKSIVYTSDVPFNESATYPHYSRSYGSLIRRMATREEPFINTFFSRYSLTEINLLPPPYDTMCVEGVSSRASCFGKCMIRKFKAIGRTPPMEILKKPSDLVHFSSKDYRDDYCRNEAVKFNGLCADECRRQSCSTDYSITYTQGYLDKDFNDLTFALLTPAAPLTVVKALVKLDLTEFLIYLCSCFGIWFGVSIFSMNPLNLKTNVNWTPTNPPNKDMSREKRLKSRLAMRPRTNTAYIQSSRMMYPKRICTV